MKQENKIVKVLIPVVAVVVLLESVMLIMNLGNKPAEKPEIKPVVTTQPTISSTEKVTKSPVYSLEISSSVKNMKLGIPATIEVKAKGNSVRSLDAINLYLKYNTTAFEASNLTFDKKLPEPNFKKISTSKSLIVANFLISAPNGLKLNKDEEVILARFQVKPLVTGNFDFEISTGNEAKESATMFVENATTEVLPFVSNKLTVNVAR